MADFEHNESQNVKWFFHQRLNTVTIIKSPTESCHQHHCGRTKRRHRVHWNNLFKFIETDSNSLQQYPLHIRLMVTFQSNEFVRQKTRIRQVLKWTRVNGQFGCERKQFDWSFWSYSKRIICTQSANILSKNIYPCWNSSINEYGIKFLFKAVISISEITLIKDSKRPQNIKL